MKNIVFALVCAAMCAEAVAADSAVKDGGIFKLSGKGRIALVDCGAGVDWDVVKPTIDKFGSAFRVELVHQQGAPFSVETAANAVGKSKANAAVFIGNRPDYPMAMASSEQKWSFVNVAPLKAGGRNFKKRFNIMLMRGIYRAIGSDASQAANSVMSPVHSPADLDVITDLDVAMDTYMGVCQSFDALGIVPIEYGTYREACEIGVAPPPTNAVQKAIWDKVHAIPSNPMKIKYKGKK